MDLATPEEDEGEDAVKEDEGNEKEARAKYEDARKVNEGERRTSHIMVRPIG